MLESFIQRRLQSDSDYLLFAKHPPVYTTGSDERDFGVETLRCDRGGSVTYFDEGSLMIYFCFLVPYPPLFFKRVVKTFSQILRRYDHKIRYDHKRPGFYIQNKKIASLGFRYRQNVSKHGVSLHLATDLDAFNKIPPCGLEDITATSFANEGIEYDEAKLKSQIQKAVHERFF